MRGKRTTAKIIALLSILIITIGMSNQQEEDSIEAHLEVNIIDTKEYGKLNAIDIVVKNNTDTKIYIPDIQPLRFSIYKRNLDGVYIDYFDNWIYDEMNRDNMALVSEAIGEKSNMNNVYNPGTRKFTDIDAKNFYYKSLVTNSKFIKNRTDTLGISSWVRDRYEELLYLDKYEEVRERIGVSSLDNGSYKLVFSYLKMVEF